MGSPIDASRDYLRAREGDDPGRRSIRSPFGRFLAVETKDLSSMRSQSMPDHTRPGANDIY